MVSRREFIKMSGIAAATSFLPSLGSNITDKDTGLILYTVRDEMAKDPDGTLKAIAATGYNWIEAADYSNGLFYNQKPSEFRKKVEGYGLKWISTHSNVNAANIDKAVDAAAEAGLLYMVLPSLPVRWNRSIEGYKLAADFFNLAGEKCKKTGLKFGFHNHWIEFKKIDGQIPYDLLMERTDPASVTYELDLCWITAGDQSAVDYINKYPGRYELFHMKDMSADKKDATMGEGIIKFKSIFGLSGKAGMKYFFVEQDNCRTHTTMESIRISRNYLLNNL